MKVGRRIDIDQDLARERIEWRLTRIFSWVLVGLIVAALLGAFGGGPLSHAQTRDGPLLVRYERLLRFGSDTDIVVDVPPQADRTMRIAIDRGLLDRFRLTHITPAPTRTIAGADSVDYLFDVEAGRSGEVVFTVQPTARWSARGHIRTPEAAVPVTAFVFP